MYGFTRYSRTDLPEYHGTGYWFIHDQSGAQVYHLHNDDPENTFALAFRTPPPDSTGVAHILEHSVLSGSREYPLKDPFLHLLKGSMNTFLNALTFPDKTVYPASSPVEKDLFNILEVYGDAVFFPLLKKELFQQEGHRLQFRADGTLERTGVVLNEMKGARATHDSVAGDWAIRALMPDTPYGLDSGGDPAEIPRLSYEAFVDFHGRYYHPSNCQIFLYGNIPTERYLDLLNRRFLSHFSAQDRPGGIVEQPRWSQPRELERSFPLELPEEDDDAGAATDPAAGQSSVTLNWLLFPVTEEVKVQALEVLAEALLGHSGSPLQKLITESELGEDLSGPSGIETELRETSFSVGMRGTSPDKKDEIVSLIEGELQRLAREGIPESIITGAMRTVEFRNREIRSGSTGIRLAGRIYRGWLHDTAPETTLEFRRPFEAVKAAVRDDPRYFEKMIQDYLLENPHRTTLIVRPDADQLERERQEAERELAEVAASLQEEDRARIRREQEALESLQGQEDRSEDVAKLPTLTVEDAPRTVPRIPERVWHTSDGAPVLHHEVFTNGVVYIDLAFALDDISEELLPYVPLFTTAVTETGLSDLSYDALSGEISLKTGGVGLSAEVSRVHEGSEDDEAGSGNGSGPSGPRAYIHARMKCLEESAEEAFELFIRMLTDADLSNGARLETLVQELRNDYRSAVLPNGHSFAALRSARGVSGTARVEDVWRGISQYFFLREIDSAEALAKVGEALETLRESVLIRSRVIASITAEERVADQIGQLLEGSLARLPMGSASEATHGLPIGRTEIPRYESLVVGAAVNYVAVSLRGTAYGSPAYAAEAALAHILRTGRLWELIRMKGGAYGAFATTRGLEELFSFVSYRDPHVLPTIESYGQAVNELAQAAPDARTVELAVIAMVGREQRPLSPGEQNSYALRWHLLGLTPELRQAHRDYVLQLKPEAVQAAAARVHERLDQAYVAVLGGRRALDHAAETIPALKEHVLEVPV